MVCHDYSCDSDFLTAFVRVSKNRIAKDINLPIQLQTVHYVLGWIPMNACKDRISGISACTRFF